MIITRKYFLKYFDIVYFLRFLILLLTLYYFNIFYIAVTDSQGKLYSSFLEHHLNYIEWLRNSILYTSNAIVHLLGINSYVSPPYRVSIAHGPYVQTVYDCLRVGLMSFWVAFVSPHKGDWKTKMLWNFIGTFSIWIINCWRIALLLIALQHGKNISGFIDHHTSFNVIAYSIIILLIHFHSKVIRKVKEAF